MHTPRLFLVGDLPFMGSSGQPDNTKYLSSFTWHFYQNQLDLLFSHGTVQTAVTTIVCMIGRMLFRQTSRELSPSDQIDQWT